MGIDWFQLHAAAAETKLMLKSGVRLCIHACSDG